MTQELLRRERICCKFKPAGAHWFLARLLARLLLSCLLRRVFFEAIRRIRIE